MPNRNQQPTQADERLSQLIRLKSAEKPDDAFWDNFGDELRSKQLAALVRVQPWYERLGRFALFSARRAAALSAACAAIAIAFTTLSPAPFANRSEPVPTPAPALVQTDEPVFTVAQTIEPAALAEPRFLETPAIDGEATYSLNVLSPQRQPERYTLVSSPKTLTTQVSSNGTSQDGRLGAKVIRINPQF